MTSIIPISEIRKLTPIQRYLYWVEEREAIRLRKEADLPKPWTNDEILRNYRFCNVRRMDDKVSKWLQDNWYTPYFNHPNMLQAVGMARFINKPESLILLTDLLFKEKKPFPNASVNRINWSSVITTLREHRNNGNVIFNGAYMVRGNDGIDKIECVVKYYVEPLSKIEIDTSNMENTHKAIFSSYGLGSFMAGQIVADLRWAVAGTWLDKDKWAPLGPGSQRGKNRLEGKILSIKCKQKEFEKFLATLIGICKKELPAKITERLEAHDYQNTLCEFDKYERALWNQGRPKQKYSGE